MANIYDYMLGDPDAERMQAAAKLLRGNQARAELAMATGDPVLGRMGQNLMRQTGQSAQGLSRARARSQAITPLGGGMYAQGGEINELPGYQESQERAYQRQLGLARARSAAAEEAWMRRAAAQREETQRREEYKSARMPETTFKEYAKVEAEATTGDKLLADLAKIDKEGKGESAATVPEDAAAATMRRVGLTGPATLYEQATQSQEVQDFRATLANWVDAYRHARFGSQLTGNEIQEFARTNPLAYGLSNRDMQARIAMIRDWYRNKGSSLAGGRLTPAGKETRTTAIETPEGAAVEEVKTEQPKVDMVFNPDTGKLEPAQ